MGAERNGRQLVKLGEDPIANANAIANAVVALGDLGLFGTDDGGMVLIDGGRRIPVSGYMVRDIIHQHVATKRAVNHGTADKEDWHVELVPVEIDDRVMRLLLSGRDPRFNHPLPGGTLASRLPKA